jgi:putative protein-disulfide isomerase
MCSWCWGFRSTWENIQANLPKSIEVQYVLGGLAPDSNEPMPEAMRKDIVGHWIKIQQHIPSTQFNFDFWEQCEPRRSSYPACRAVIAAKKQNPETEKLMIKAIQTAYYLNAKNPSNDETLVTLAKQLSLDEAKFSVDINSVETQQQLKNEILFAQKIGARGFPSMIIEKGGNYLYVPLNYNNSREALAFINAELL